jgi:UDP:flavonoid glycosyltransferase YjiC (YdhE family)
MVAALASRIDHMSDVVVFGSPVSVGHVRPLMPIARRLVERGLTVVWAISGDGNEPASAWERPLTELGVQFIDLDQIAKFERVVTAGKPTVEGLRRRVLARANDVSAGAADAIRTAVAGRRIVGGVMDFFALWAYVAMKRLDVSHIDVLVSAFPSQDVLITDTTYERDDVYQRELTALRAIGVTGLDAPMIYGFVPVDPSVRMFATTSRQLCPDAPDFIRLVGVPREALPSTDVVPQEHAALVQRLRAARSEGIPVLLLSMGSIALRFAPMINPEFPAFLRSVYVGLATSALRAGAIVIASTAGTTAEALGIDDASLGEAARERLIAMPFVPQPLLFAHGLVDAMLMHGGANTFHETAIAGIPTLVCPLMSDQGAVARAVSATGVGVCIESIGFPGIPGALSLDHVVTEILPKLLAPENPWKRTAALMAPRLANEDGVSAAVSFVLGETDAR